MHCPVELLFKRHFWVVHLLFIFVVMVLATRTGNAFLESALMPLPSGGRAKVTRPKAVEPLAALNPERLSKLTGLPLPKEPEVTAPTVPTVDLNAPPVRSSLRVKLLGKIGRASCRERV